MLTTEFTPREKEAWLKKMAKAEKARERAKAKALKSKKKGRKRKRGRKKRPSQGPRKAAFKFSETLLGRFMETYAPLELHLLSEWKKRGVRSANCLMIETIAQKSGNPAFKSARFRRALVSYKRFGLRPKRKTRWNLKDALYYARNAYPVVQLIASISGDSPACRLLP